MNQLLMKKPLNQPPDAGGGTGTVYGADRAERGRFLVDGASYFELFADVCQRARRSIFILGWDFDSRAQLAPEDDRRDVRIGPFITDLVRRTPELRVYILVWDLAPIYALEREPLPRIKLGLGDDDRIRFAYDSDHPSGASHHQKVVVVDDSVAFIGGMDLTAHRWDTPEHSPDDPRRLLPNGRRYPPHHDVHLALSGPIAARLGELARDRWRRGTGEEPEPISPSDLSLPSEGPMMMEDAEVTVVVTDPERPDRPAIRETEEWLIRAIRGARRTIFIENQFITSRAIGRALADRLAEPEGPEVVIVTLAHYKGLREEWTLGVARSRVFAQIREADRAGRLHLYAPRLADGTYVYIHSKVLVIDDALAYVGSANLTGRSMGLDTESGVVIEARGLPGVARNLVALRDGLLAEHLDVSPERVSREIREAGSVGGAIEALRSDGRSLTADVETEVPVWLDEMAPASDLLDPPSPLELDANAPTAITPKDVTDEGLAPADGEEPSRRAALGGVGILLIILGVVALWRWTAVGHWLAPERIAAWAEPWHWHPLAAGAAIAGVALTASLGIPITVMVVALALGFGPVEGGAYSFCGALLSSVIGFGLGKELGRAAVKRLLGERTEAVARRVRSAGVLSVAVARLVPIAPFAVINLTAGSSGMSWRPFVAGTAISLVPGIAVVSFLGDRISSALMASDATVVLLWLGLAAALLALWALLRHRGRV